MFDEDTKRMDKITMTVEPLPICTGLKDVGYESIKNIVREMMKNKSMKFIFLFYLNIINRIKIFLIFFSAQLLFV